MYISEFQYLALLALGAHSVIQIWKSFCVKLVTTIKENDVRSDNDWSVVGGKGDKTKPQRAMRDHEWSDLMRTIADSRVKELFCGLSSTVCECGQSGAGRSLLLFKMAFWPIVTAAHLSAVLKAHRYFSSTCRRENAHFDEVANAYETLTDDATGTNRESWREHSNYVNTPDFVYCCCMLNLVCFISWHVIFARVRREGVVKDFRSFLAALRNDWSLTVLVLWSLVLSMLLCFILDQVWIETQNPFRVLDISTYATLKEIKRAYRRLSLRYHPECGEDCWDYFS